MRFKCNNIAFKIDHMDIEQAKTFLEIIHSGTFARAAERLHVTQTTVTARVQALEAALSCRLFTRNRAGAKLTKHGEAFVTPAKNMLEAWEQAKQICGHSAHHIQQTLNIGGEISLWNPILIDWLFALNDAMPQWLVNSQVATTDLLYQSLQKKEIDAIIVHSPRYLTGLVVEQIAEEKLIHVASCKQPSPDLFIDWGEEFSHQFDRCIPFNRQTAMQFSLGPMALRYLLAKGGNGYFRTRVVEKYIQEGRLKKVNGATEFTYPIYLIYHKNNPLGESFEQAKAQLFETIKAFSNWSI
ncbi:LysR family transcriptional regulator [Marinomonas sp. M1K-6]|uniref:LysR family transcriptional regulator n=1 Tax=Marinomonas profundi TaxID=2726122 RepID=A0A847R8U0_9GAMM|nr:LysR family transcriptional regulator [Marinomonas profundi]NLQ18883.1 LysR family transcriptional regulator [Marinomonas profundi]UDV01810.1 LysR family transcriptional regulator [Marinomonas profundi]